MGFTSPGSVSFIKYLDKFNVIKVPENVKILTRNWGDIDINLAEITLLKSSLGRLSLNEVTLLLRLKHRN
jgi:hypothetical protein